jgi:Flp pilus assembly protein TadG
MLARSLRRLCHDEAGTSLLEFSLFVGLLFLAGAGFVCYSASQFQGVFMAEGGMKF